MSNNFFEALHQIAAEKGISKEEIESIVESAMLSAYKKQYGICDNVKTVFDREKNILEIISQKVVVKKVTNKAEQIAYEEAVKIKPEIEVGDDIFVGEDPFASFGRIAVQTAKQVIMQKVKEAEKNIIYNEFKGKEGDLINGYLQRKFRDAVYVELGRTEGVLPLREQSPLEHYKIGDRVKALILAVQKDSRGANILLSRAHPKFIEKLFEMEIPEIYDGIVRILKIVREPGLRTKVLVMSDKDDIDPVGACVGMKGIRIQSIVRELEGEKIDIIEYVDDKKELIASVLTPATITEVIETTEGSYLAVVEEEQYKLAVGRSGHNAKLTSRLCEVEVTIKTEDQYREFLNSSEAKSLIEQQLFSQVEDDEEETALEELVDLDKKVVKLLYGAGIDSVETLVEKTLEDLTAIEGIDEGTAKQILEIIAESVDFEEEEEE